VKSNECLSRSGVRDLTFLKAGKTRSIRKMVKPKRCGEYYGGLAPDLLIHFSQRRRLSESARGKDLSSFRSIIFREEKREKEKGRENERFEITRRKKEIERKSEKRPWK